MWSDGLNRRRLIAAILNLFKLNLPKLILENKRRGGEIESEGPISKEILSTMSMKQLFIVTKVANNFFV